MNESSCDPSSGSGAIAVTSRRTSSQISWGMWEISTGTISRGLADVGCLDLPELFVSMVSLTTVTDNFDAAFEKNVMRLGRKA